MNLQRWVSGFSILALILAIATLAAGIVSQAKLSASSSTPQIWFSSSDDLEAKGVVARPDFMRLFDPRPSWPAGTACVNVMQLRALWLLGMPAETVQIALDFLKQHNMALAVAQTPSPEIWLGPAALPAPGPSVADLMDMFTPDAPWKIAASHTQVFMLQGAFVSRASQGQLNSVVDLNRRDIAIAVAVGVMNVPHDPPSGCGGLGNVEGYGTEQQAAKIAGAIKAAGGKVKYLVMDEPLYFGHYYTQAPGKGAGCHSSIQQIVQLIEPTLDVYRQTFPDLVVGEVEPTFFIDGQTDWRGDFFSWAAAYRATTGRPLAFMHLDIEWPLHNGVEDALAVYGASQGLQRQGLLGKIGVIYNGSRQDQSDESWMKAARDHLMLMEGQNTLRPEHIIFQSWTPNPTHAMPESDPNALTSLVDFYLRRVAHPSASTWRTQ